MFSLSGFEADRDRPVRRFRADRRGRRTGDPAGFQRLRALYGPEAVRRPVAGRRDPQDRHDGKRGRVDPGFPDCARHAEAVHHLRRDVPLPR